MKFSIRSIRSVALLLVAAVCLTGCGGGGSTTSVDPKAGQTNLPSRDKKGGKGEVQTGGFKQGE
jgi:hypothetical protein